MKRLTFEKFEISFYNTFGSQFLKVFDILGRTTVFRKFE